MPRPNRPREVAYEATLASRIRDEREKRKWTNEQLARRMTDAGCAMQGSAIYKIENGDPPRRITLDEAITFASVFETTLQALLVPSDVALTREALKLYERYLQVSDRYNAIAEELEQIQARLVAVVYGRNEDAVAGALEEAHGPAAIQAVELSRIVLEDFERLGIRRMGQVKD